MKTYRMVVLAEEYSIVSDEHPSLMQNAITYAQNTASSIACDSTHAPHVPRILVLSLLHCALELQKKIATESESVAHCEDLISKIDRTLDT